MATTYTCTRCNGTGRHSFNLQHGTRCFSCNGSGLQRTKPRAPAPRWAVFGQHRATGQWLRIYNVTAKTSEAAIAIACATYAKASTDWRATYDLNPATARAMTWTSMSHPGALTWDEATTKAAA
jgi:hypothetical protein